MATIDTSGKPAYMYDADTSTWYAISGRVPTSANYIWSGSHQFDNNSFFNGAITATLKFNSFLNPAARTSAIPSPGVGLITFLEQDAGGTTINRFEYWNGSAWVIMADLTSAQTLTNKTLTSPTISGASISGTVSGAPTFSGNITFSGTPVLTGTLTNNGTISGGTISSATINSPVLVSPEEKVAVSATSATGAVQFDALTQGVLYYTSNASANFTLNFRGDASTTLSSILSTGQSITCSFINTNGSTGYYPTAISIDGSSVTPKWSGGSAPTSGNANSVDAYSFTIIKTGTTSYTVLAGSVRFA